MSAVDQEPTPTAPHVGASRSLRPWLLPAVVLVVLVVDVAWAWMSTSRGLDVSDEGYYLATARWFRHPELAATGAPALLGPLFHLVGLSVPWLRRLRLLLQLGSGAGLGWSLGQLLDPTREARPRRVALALFGAVGALTIYGSLPQSPGYNDASVLATTAMATCTLQALRAPGRRRLVWAGLLGCVATAQLVVKWPAGMASLAVAGACAIVALGVRPAVRTVPAVLAGVVVGSALLHLVSGDLPQLLSELRSTSSTITSELPVWDTYIVPYRDNVTGTLGDLLRSFGLVPIAYAGAFVWYRRGHGTRVHAAAIAAGTATSAWVCWFAGRDDLARGGLGNVVRVQRLLPLVMLAVLAVWCARAVVAPASRPDGPDDGHAAPPMRTAVPAVVMVLALVGTQAVGTLNDPLYVASFAGALAFVGSAGVAWLARRALSPVTTPAVAVLLAGALLAPGHLLRTGTWGNPYRNLAPLSKQTVPVQDAPYRGLSVDAPMARLLHELHALRVERQLDGRSGLSLFGTPGLAYALGLRPPLADLFVRAVATTDTAAGLFDARVEAACTRGYITAAEPPVLLTVAGTDTTYVQRMLHGCGVSFPDGYEVVSFTNPGLVDAPPGNVRVWIPKA